MLANLNKFSVGWATIKSCEAVLFDFLNFIAIRNSYHSYIVPIYDIAEVDWRNNPEYGLDTANSYIIEEFVKSLEHGFLFLRTIRKHGKHYAIWSPNSSTFLLSLHL